MESEEQFKLPFIKQESNSPDDCIPVINVDAIKSEPVFFRPDEILVDFSLSDSVKVKKESVKDDEQPEKREVDPLQFDGEHENEFVLEGDIHVNKTCSSDLETPLALFDEGPVKSKCNDQGEYFSYEINALEILGASADGDSEGQYFLDGNQAANEENVSKPKPYTCNECQRSFSKMNHLKRHYRIHTGERPYRCTQCPSTFANSGGLKEHTRTHTGEKPYICPVCQQNFRQSSSLRTHLRTHTGEKPYSCTVCQQNFTRSNSLKKHMRIHTGEKPFICSQCGFAFAQSGHLVEHMRIHTGEKPFTCDECQRTFARKSNLKAHLKSHK